MDHRTRAKEDAAIHVCRDHSVDGGWVFWYWNTAGECMQVCIQMCVRVHVLCFVVRAESKACA
jgi:hypothetical protein